MQRTVQDIPDSEVNFVLATIKADGGTLVAKTRQDDGKWTVTATFPDVSGGAAPRSGAASPPARPRAPSPDTLPAQAGRTEPQVTLGGQEEAIDTLARTLWGEARGEGPRGMEAVACVVMNRVTCAVSHFGASVTDVCQKPAQFSCWNASDSNRARLLAVTTADTDFAQSLAIAARAVDGALADFTAGATHYHTRAVRPGWAAGKTPCFELGDHLFYNNVG